MLVFAGWGVLEIGPIGLMGRMGLIILAAENGQRTPNNPLSPFTKGEYSEKCVVNGTAADAEERLSQNCTIM